jgi:hypothetical protein
LAGLRLKIGRRIPHLALATRSSGRVPGPRSSNRRSRQRASRGSPRAFVAADLPRATEQNDNTVGEHQRLVDVVGDEQHSRSIVAPDFEQVFLQRHSGKGVERAQWLVAQQ